MLYLLDANVLITAHNTYYALDQVPEFWAWLHYQGVNGKIKVPREMMDEVLAGNPDDLLYKWIRAPRNRDALVLDENPNPPLIQKIVNGGYGKDLSDHELEQIGQDPFLVAHAMTSLN